MKFFWWIIVLPVVSLISQGQEVVPTHRSLGERDFRTEDNGKTRYYFKDGMMWERGARFYDNLWRTSIACIAYGDPELKKGMLNCLEWETPHRIKYYRSTNKKDKDVSRDQVTMFLVAMKLQGGDVKKYVKATPWKLSDRFSLTIDMWLWMRALAGNKLAKKLFYGLELPVVKSYYLLNKSNLTKRKFPAFAVHLLAWQMYAIEDGSPFHEKICTMVRNMADEDNYLVKMLTGEQVSPDEIRSVVPTTDFQWQRGQYDTNVYMRPLTDEEAAYNLISIDILTAIYEQTKCE